MIIEKWKKRIKKNKFSLLLFSFIFMIIFLNLNDVKALKTSADDDFSDKLQHEAYTPITSVSNWYDGIETFWYDSHLANPIFWKVNEPTGIDIHVYNSINSHSNVLRMVDSNTGNRGNSSYFFELDNYYNANYFNISFWTFTASYLYLNEIKIIGNPNYMVGIMSYNNYIDLIWNDGSGNEYDHSFTSYTVDTWFYITLELKPIFSGVPPSMSLISYELSIYVDKTLYHTETLLPVSFDFDLARFQVLTDSVNGYTYSVCLDGISIRDLWGMNPYYTQILNSETSNNVIENYLVLDSSKEFSLYNSIIDKYPSSDNNYRTFFLTDIINNVDLLSKNRILRLVGTDNTQNKYKALQFYFTDLDNVNSFLDGYNQTLEILVNTYDSSNLLINMLKFNMEFNNETGLITWNAKYRESASLPIWKDKLTNPIFDFDDYLQENENLTSIQVNTHFFLTYNLTNKLLFIRTEVCFNDNSDLIYTYDKLIDLGYGSFYFTQSKLKVMYIDIINPNSAKDYVNNTWYTYNNLRGIRTLKSNSTDYFFNFLNMGFFSDDLSYYQPPDDLDDIPEDEDLTPREPNLPYWYFDSYYLENHENYTIFFKNGYYWVNHTEQYNTTFEFGFLKGVKYSAKYFYNPKQFERDKDYSWTIKIPLLNWKFKFSVVNWIIDIFFTVVNNIWLGIQAIGYFISGILVSSIFLWLLFVLIVPFLNNIIWFYFLFGLLFVVHWIIIGVLNLIGYSYPLLIFLITFFLEVIVPTAIKVIIIILALIIALIIWLLSGGQADYEKIFIQTVVFLYLMFDFMIASIIYFVANIEFFMFYIILYIIFVGLGYFKLWYRKIKGHTNSASRLELALKGMIYPFYLVYLLALKIKQLVSPNS